jgi:hypothetical protein
MQLPVRRRHPPWPSKPLAALEHDQQRAASASGSTSKMRRRSANDCCDIPLPVSSRAIRFASAKLSAASAACGARKTLLLRGPTKRLTVSPK